MEKEIFSTPEVRVDLTTKPVVQLINCENVEKRYRPVAAFSEMKIRFCLLLAKSIQSHNAQQQSLWGTKMMGAKLRQMFITILNKFVKYVILLHKY